MKKEIKQIALLVVGIAALAPTLFAQLNVPSDGSDGALNITSNTVINLNLASYGAWTNDNSANPGNGIYDPTKWAIVFKYSSISIAANASVTFSNHASHAPVVWLVQSNASINGTVNLSGNGVDYASPAQLVPTEPGPGGFRGGAFGPSGAAAGYGPAGGQPGQGSTGNGYGNGYGNPKILPLMGGCGSGSWNINGNFAGAGGGGAILIIAGQTATINGSIVANGASASTSCGNCFVVSGGGAIRVVANSIQGNGYVTASVVRTEANSISPQLVLTPNTIAVPPGTNLV
ncbi:MAG TPA: hypothetical protein VFC44_26965 [Candidatus Saccharimonadales bacterium]|nr:hypothetical protein [Candidatus Saccharimonadales bacterium]